MPDVNVPDPDPSPRDAGLAAAHARIRGDVNHYLVTPVINPFPPPAAYPDAFVGGNRSPRDNLSPLHHTIRHRPATTIWLACASHSGTRSNRSHSAARSMSADIPSRSRFCPPRLERIVP